VSGLFIVGNTDLRQTAQRLFSRFLRAFEIMSPGGIGIVELRDICKQFIIVLNNLRLKMSVVPASRFVAKSTHQSRRSIELFYQ
ncbi:MAG: hypothetical protein ABW160_20440, partial [Candidatus Thiodiazotropha sp. 4PDIV1]